MPDSHHQESWGGAVALKQRGLHRAYQTRQAWVNAALGILASSGVDAINVESLGRLLKLSKGSFYWHFGDRAELLDAVLDEWRRREEGRFAVDGDSANSAAEKLARLFELACNLELARLETALYAWARKDANAAEAVSAVERNRRGYLAEILCVMGFPQPQAERWTEALYLAYLGILERVSRAGASIASAEQMRESFSRLILAAAVLEGQQLEEGRRAGPGRVRATRRKPGPGV